MKGLNENAGVVVLVSLFVLLAVFGVVIVLLFGIRKRLSTQKLKFFGQFSVDPDTRRMTANITLSNRSLNDITIMEMGLRNGSVNFDYTETYKKQNNLSEGARVVVGQRDAIRFSLSAEELVKTLIQSESGSIVLKKISVYAMDSTGIAYNGVVPDVKKLLKSLAKNGIDYLAPAFIPQTITEKTIPAKSTLEKSASEQSASEKPAFEKPASEKSASEKSAFEKPAFEKPAEGAHPAEGHGFPAHPPFAPSPSAPPSAPAYGMPAHPPYGGAPAPTPSAFGSPAAPSPAAPSPAAPPIPPTPPAPRNPRSRF